MRTRKDLIQILVQSKEHDASDALPAEKDQGNGNAPFKGDEFDAIPDDGEPVFLHFQGTQPLKMMLKSACGEILDDGEILNPTFSQHV